MPSPPRPDVFAVSTRFEEPLLKALDAYRRTLPEIRPRSEVIRLLVARGLGVEPEQREVSGHPLRARQPDAMNRPNPPRKRGRPPKRRPEAEQPAA